MTSTTKFLQKQLETASTGWNIGIFGALAEFHRDAEEPAKIGELSVVTGRGAIRLAPHDDAQPVPFTPRSAKQAGRDLGIAVCLPEAAARMPSTEVLTELGPDSDAIRETDRGATLFELGLGSPYGVFCVRTADPEQIALLRRSAGKRLLEAGNTLFDEIACMSPQRVFMSRLGRIEVYQGIAPRGSTTPPGPHTHLLPRLVSRKRTHSANALLPPGLVPCATFYPATS